VHPQEHVLRYRRYGLGGRYRCFKVGYYVFGSALCRLLHRLLIAQSERCALFRLRRIIDIGIMGIETAVDAALFGSGECKVAEGAGSRPS
jgi:hypothetical protein